MYHFITSSTKRASSSTLPLFLNLCVDQFTCWEYFKYHFIVQLIFTYLQLCLFSTFNNLFIYYYFGCSTGPCLKRKFKRSKKILQKSTENFDSLCKSLSGTVHVLIVNFIVRLLHGKLTVVNVSIRRQITIHYFDIAAADGDKYCNSEVIKSNFTVTLSDDPSANMVRIHVCTTFFYWLVKNKKKFIKIKKSDYFLL